MGEEQQTLRARATVAARPLEEKKTAQTTQNVGFLKRCQIIVESSVAPPCHARVSCHAQGQGPHGNTRPTDSARPEANASVARYGARIPRTCDDPSACTHNSNIILPDCSSHGQEPGQGPQDGSRPHPSGQPHV